MTKTFLTLALIACSVSLFSCSSEPSDLRPGNKVSVDVVPPGTRNTNNLDNAADHSEHDQKTEVMVNHDEGDNKLKDTNKNVSPQNQATNADSVENHN